MTKDEYIEWKATRGEDAYTSKWWDADKCREADALIKETTLANLRSWLAATSPKLVADYTLLMVKCHFGSMETDEFLTKLKMYPEWM